MTAVRVTLTVTNFEQPLYSISRRIAARNQVQMPASHKARCFNRTEVKHSFIHVALHLIRDSVAIKEVSAPAAADAEGDASGSAADRGDTGDKSGTEVKVACTGAKNDGGWSEVTRSVSGDAS